MKVPSPPCRPVRYGAEQLSLNNSAYSWDLKLRRPVLEPLVLHVQPGTIGSHSQALYRSSAER